MTTAHQKPFPQTATPTLNLLLSQSTFSPSQQQQTRILASMASGDSGNISSQPQYVRPDIPSTSEPLWGSVYQTGYRSGQECLTNGIDGRSSNATHATVNALRQQEGGASPAQRPSSTHSSISMSDSMASGSGQPMSPIIQMRHSPVSPASSVYGQQQQQSALFRQQQQHGSAPSSQMLKSGEMIPLSAQHQQSHGGNYGMNYGGQMLQPHPQQLGAPMAMNVHHMNGPMQLQPPPYATNNSNNHPFVNGSGMNPYGAPGGMEYAMNSMPPMEYRTYVNNPSQHQLQAYANSNRSMASTPPAMGSFSLAANQLPQRHGQPPIGSGPSVPSQAVYSNGPVNNSIGDSSRDSIESSAHSVKEESDSSFSSGGGGGSGKQRHTVSHRSKANGLKLEMKQEVSHPPTPGGMSPASSSMNDDQDESSLSSPSWPHTPLSPTSSSGQRSVSSKSKSESASAKESGGSVVQRLLADAVCSTPQEFEDRKQFYERLVQFCESRGHPVTGQPTVSKQTVDLYRLYLAVKGKGGFEEVTKQKLWKELCVIAKLQTSSTSSYQLRRHYIRYLLPFECFFDLGGVDHTPLAALFESKRKPKSADVGAPVVPNKRGKRAAASTPASSGTSAAAVADAVLVAAAQGNGQNFREPGTMGPPAGPFTGGPSDAQQQQQPFSQGYAMQPQAAFGPGPGGAPPTRFMPGQQQPGQPPLQQQSQQPHAVGPPMNEMVCDPFDERPRQFAVATSGVSSAVGYPPAPPQQQQPPPHYPGRSAPGGLMPQASNYYNNNQYNVPTPPAQQLPLESYPPGRPNFPSTSQQPLSNAAADAAAGGMQQPPNAGMFGAQQQAPGHFINSGTQDNRYSTVRDDASNLNNSAMRGQYDPLMGQNAPSMYRPPHSNLAQPPGFGSAASQTQPGVPSQLMDSSAPQHLQQNAPTTPASTTADTSWNQSQLQSPLPPPVRFSTPHKQSKKSLMAAAQQAPGQMPHTRAMIRERVTSSASAVASAATQQQAQSGFSNNSLANIPPSSSATPATAGPGALLPFAPQQPTAAAGTARDFMLQAQQQQQQKSVGAITVPLSQISMYGMPGSSAQAPFPASKKETTLTPFPVGSVEATELEVGRKRKKLMQKDIGPIEGWRLVMSLRSGLPAETAWALNVLNVLLYDDATAIYFNLNQLPGLVEALTDFYGKNLAEVFGVENFGNCVPSLTIEQPKAVTKSFPLEAETAATAFPSFLLPDEQQPAIVSENAATSSTGNNSSVAPTLSSAKTSDALPSHTVLKSSTNFTFRSRQGKMVRFDSALLPTDFILPGLTSKASVDDPLHDNENKPNDQNLTNVELATDRCASEESTDEDSKCAGNSVRRHYGPSEHSINGFNARLLMDAKDLIASAKAGINKRLNCSHACESAQPSAKRRKSCDATYGTIIVKEEPLSECACDEVASTETSATVKAEPKQEPDTDSLLCEQKSSPNDFFFFKNRKFELSDEIQMNSLAPVASMSELADATIEKCRAVSGIIRGLSFIPGNDAVMCKSKTLLSLVGKILMLNHVHLSKPSAKSSQSLQSLESCFADAEAASVSSPAAEKSLNSAAPVNRSNAASSCTNAPMSDWCADCLNWLRDDALVILCNISAHMDLFAFDDDVSRPILDALLHWVTCPAGYALDPLQVPGCVLSPLRYGLEILCKLSVQEHNVDLMLATAPWERIEAFMSQMVAYLGPTEDIPLREFAIVLLSAFAMSSEVAAIFVAQETGIVQLLVAFLEQADANMHQVVQQQGMAALRENPELMGTSVGMLRRAAHTLLYMARLSENRYRFARHQPRLLQFTMSQLMDSRVANTVADVLHELQKERVPTVNNGNNSAVPPLTASNSCSGLSSAAGGFSQPTTFESTATTLTTSTSCKDQTMLTICTASLTSSKMETDTRPTAAVDATSIETVSNDTNENLTANGEERRAEAVQQSNVVTKDNSSEHLQDLEVQKLKREENQGPTVSPSNDTAILGNVEADATELSTTATN